MVQFYISWLGIVLITFLTTSIETMVNFWSFSWNQWRYTITEWRMKYSLSSNCPTNIIHIRCIIGCSLYTILRVTFCSVAAPFLWFKVKFPAYADTKRCYIERKSLSQLMWLLRILFHPCLTTCKKKPQG